MWFSPWRRILRGRSGDAKPSGLRAGTKFVEEDTGVEYTYDPVMKDWKKKVASYSALVAKDGSTVWAEDASGKTIASGESGVDDASVIQSAIDVVLEEGCGKVVVKPDFNQDRVIKIIKNVPIIVEFLGKSTPTVDNINLLEIGDGSDILGSGATPIIIKGFRWDAKGRNGITGIKLIDAQPVLYNIYGKYGDVGIDIHVKNYQCERVTIHRGVLTRQKKSLTLTTEKDTDSSFSQLDIRNLALDLPTEVGFEINQHCMLYRHKIFVGVWLGADNAKGLYVDGTISQGDFQIHVERSLATSGDIGIDIGANAEVKNAVIRYYYSSSLETIVNNPYDKPITILVSGRELYDNYRLVWTEVNVGTNDTYGTPLEIKHPYWKPLNVRAIGIWLSGTFATDETVTVKLTAYDYGGGSSYREFSFTAPEEKWLEPRELHYIVRSGLIWKIVAEAKTNLSSTSVTVNVAGIL